MKLFIVLAFTLFSATLAIDFKIIGQDELVQFIQGRYDLDGQGEVSEETLGNTLRDILVTDLDIIDTGDVEYDELTGSAGNKGVIIEASSDSKASVSVTGVNGTRSSSSERKGDADIQVATRRVGIVDIVYINGTLSRSLSGKRGGKTVTITQEISLTATVTTSRAGSPKAFKALPEYRDYVGLLKANKAANKRGVSVTTVAYVSGKRIETTVGAGKARKSEEFSNGNVVVISSPKLVSITGRSNRNEIRNGSLPIVENTVWTSGLVL